MRANGDEFPVELIVTRLPSNGPPVFAGFVRDISERKRADEALRDVEVRQRAFMRDVLGSVTEGKLRLCLAETELPAAARAGRRHHSAHPGGALRGPP